MTSTPWPLPEAASSRIRAASPVRAAPAACPAASRDGWDGLFREVFGDAPRRILDVGCGDGGATLLFDALGHLPQGVDADAENVRRGRERAAARCVPVPFVAGDPEDLRFPAGAFDGVHARGLLAALVRPEIALLECYRVLRPGGTALVVEPSDHRRTADHLRRAGFLDVREREERLPRRCGPPPARGARWYRLWTTPTAAFRVAWGRRP